MRGFATGIWSFQVSRSRYLDSMDILLRLGEFTIWWMYAEREQRLYSIFYNVESMLITMNVEFRCKRLRMCENCVGKGSQ